jgi:hypothetical protein
MHVLRYGSTHRSDETQEHVLGDAALVDERADVARNNWRE